MNFKKKMSVAVAAAVCCSMIAATSSSVYAEEYVTYDGASIVSELSASDPAYTEAVKLAGLKFNSGLAKKVRSYDGKKSKSSVSFGKSRTKKFIEKYSKNAEKMAADPSTASISLSMVSADEVVCLAMKGDKMKTVIYMNSDDVSMGIAMYMDSNTSTILDLAEKQKVTMPNSSEENTMDFDNTTEALTGFDIKDSQKGKLFKFKYKDKGYYYEVFETEDGEKMGFVFDTKQNLVMMADDTSIVSVKISTSVKNSEMTVPDGYTEVELDY